MKCLGCHEYEALNHPIYGIMKCAACRQKDSMYQYNRAPEFVNISQHERINEQREKDAVDFLQPYNDYDKNVINPEFVKHYPEQAKTWFKEEELKGLV